MKNRSDFEVITTTLFLSMLTKLWIKPPKFVTQTFVFTNLQYTVNSQTRLNQLIKKI